MSSYNKTSTYNRTYERKVIEEPTRVISGTVGGVPMPTTMPSAGGQGSMGGGGPPINISSSTFATTPMFMGHPVNGFKKFLMLENF
jgi:hypothetical protein